MDQAKGIADRIKVATGIVLAVGALAAAVDALYERTKGLALTRDLSAGLKTVLAERNKEQAPSYVLSVAGDVVAKDPDSDAIKAALATAAELFTAGAIAEAAPSAKDTTAPSRHAAPQASSSSTDRHRNSYRRASSGKGCGNWNTGRCKRIIPGASPCCSSAPTL